MSKYKNLLIKLVVSIGLFAVLFSRISFQEVYTNIKLLDASYIPLIIVFLILNYVISAVRWKSLLIFDNTAHVSVSYLTKLYFVGSFFNNFMPTSIGGDVYKIFKLGKKISSASHAFSATFMERFTGVIALVIISYVGLLQTLDFWLQLLPSNITSNNILVFLLEILVFVGFWIAAIFGFLSLKIVGKKIEKVNTIYESLMEYKSRYKVLASAFLTSFIVQLLAIFTQFFIFKALGYDLPVLFSLFVFPIITLASFFIPSLNGLGVQDTLYVQLFSTVGVSSQIAITASILYHLFRLLVSLIGGVLYAVEKDI